MSFNRFTFPAYGSRAFTLIELLLVIAIIGFLSAIALNFLNDARVSARNIKATESINQITTALLLYYDTHGKFPCHENQYAKDGSDNYNSNFLKPLFDEKLINFDVIKYHTYPLEYAGISDATGCGKLAHLGFYAEGASIKCPHGFGHPHTSQGRPHCHQILPEPPVSVCSDPYFTAGLNCGGPYTFDTVNEY